VRLSPMVERAGGPRPDRTGSMRWLLDRLRTRVGAALGLILLIGIAITVGRLAGEGQALPVPRYEPAPLTTVTPTAGDDGVVDLTPSVAPTDEKPLAAAAGFATAWLRADLAAEDWHAGVVRHTTQSLAADLEGVDPSSVPAKRRVGEPRVLIRDEAYIRIAVPMDTGTLTLNVFKNDGEWLVGEVDWEPT
jgi:hypothetical protein